MLVLVTSCFNWDCLLRRHLKLKDGAGTFEVDDGGKGTTEWSTRLQGTEATLGVLTKDEAKSTGVANGIS